MEEALQLEELQVKFGRMEEEMTIVSNESKELQQRLSAKDEEISEKVGLCCSNGYERFKVNLYIFRLAIVYILLVLVLDQFKYFTCTRP